MRYYVTTTIPYVNGRPHIGHALEFVQADALARHRRQRGDQVRLQSGTDDNALKNVRAAEHAGVSTAEFVAANALQFSALQDALNISVDHFVRTSADPEHAPSAQRLWGACHEAGDIYKRAYSGRYCVGCEEFVQDQDLVDGLCLEHQVPPELVEEENWFFRLSGFGDRLLDAIENGTLQIIPDTRRREIEAFIRGGLQDFSISRSVERARGWGVPVPGDATQIMYVWFDALTNYISTLGYASGADDYSKWWADGAERVHVVGKGVIRFHAVYWPAILMSAGIAGPDVIYVHEYLTVNGQKISKSLGNAADATKLCESYGQDALRYWLLREPSRTADTDFTEQRLVERHDRDLANDLGNLVNRTVSMVHRYRDGRVPAPFEQAHGDLEVLAHSLRERVALSLADFDFRAALETVWELVTAANRLVETSRPWDLFKSERTGDAQARRALDGLLYTLLEAIAELAHILQPFLPTTAARMGAAIGLPGTLGWGAVATGAAVGPAEPLFPRIHVARQHDRA
jgi:methionyl-tRNA synthetase